jgi:hypothetical protein
VMNARERETEQKWMCRAHVKHSTSPIFNCQSSYEIRDSWFSTSLNGWSYREIPGVSCVQTASMFPANFVIEPSTRFIHYEAQQEGNKIKQIFRQSEWTHCSRNTRQEGYILGGTFLAEVLIFFFASERWNQSFVVTSASGSDGETA